MAKRAAATGRSGSPSVDPGEIGKFSAMAEEWWDTAGKFRPLHRLNPIRLHFIRDRIAERFQRDPRGERPFEGLTILDVGCGGGLLCEPLARLGAGLTGIDASGQSVKVAALHAAESGLEIDYRHATAEALAEAGETYDVVLNMEVVEHVVDATAFLGTCCALVKPGGAMAVATLNRTAKSFVLAIVGAEYVLRWLPRGTHDWRKFLRPSELTGALRDHGLEVGELTGVVYNPLTASWRLGRDLEVNYMTWAVKA